MTRETMIERLIANDITDIMQAYAENDTEFLERVLRGDGFIGYNHLTDTDILQEYQAREFEEEKEDTSC